MKTSPLVLAFFLLFTIQTSFAQRFWVGSSASNWNNPANWSNVSGGAGGFSVPGATDVVTFNAARNGNCTIDVPVTIAGLTINGYTGIVDLSSFDLTTTGANTFTTGTINGGTGSLKLNTTLSTTFNGTLVNANLTGTTGRIFFNGSTFNGSVDVIKTDANNDNSIGNNIFNGVTTITNATNGVGTGQILLGNGARDQFNGVTTFNNNGTYRIYIAYNHAAQTTTFATDVTLNSNKSGGADAWSYLIADIGASRVSFGGKLTINCAGTLSSNHRIVDGAGSSVTYGGLVTINNTNTNVATNIYMGTNGTSTYNGSIVVNNSNTTTTAGVFFNLNGGAASTLAAGQTISTTGFLSGNLSLPRFTQIGATDQTLVLSSNATILTIGPASSFDGNVDFRSSRLFLNGATYNGTAYLEKLGGIRDDGNGGNVFNKPTTIVNSAANYLLSGRLSPDIFNDDLIANSTGSSSIRLADNVAGNQFNGNITVTSTGSSQGIYFGNGAAGRSTFAAGATNKILIGAGFSSGTLYLSGFTQTGTSSQTLALTGTANLNIGGSSASSFDGNVDFRSPSLFVSNSTFNGTAYLEKNGSSLDQLTGGNVFNGITTISHTGSGVWVFSIFGTVGDVFNSDLTISNTGTSLIRMADNKPGNQFNGNITVTSTGSSLGIFFGNGTAGKSTFAAGATKKILIGAGGYSSGTLNLSGFTQTGTSSQTLALTGAANLNIGGISASSFDGNVDFRSPSLFVSNSTFNGTAYLEKNGSSVDQMTGGNVFNGATTLTHTGSGAWIFSFSGTVGDIFNGDLTIVNTGSSQIRLADNQPGNQFNGNITVTSTGSSQGVFFGRTASGRSTFAAGATKKIALGAGGFSSGTLGLSGFMQTGTSSQALILTGSAVLNLGNPSATSFDGDVDFRSPSFVISRTTFNGTAYLEKNGSSLDLFAGGNVFNGATTLTHTGSGAWIFSFSGTVGDIFNGDLTIVNTGSSTIRLADNQPGNQFNGNITVTSTGSSQGVFFGRTASGRSTFAAGATKKIALGAGGFSSGTLWLSGFMQTGTSSQALVLTGSAVLILGNPSATSFDGDVDFRSPSFVISRTTFNGTAYLEKNGSSLDLFAGGNVFNGATTLTHTGSGAWIFSYSAGPSGDIFNSDLTIVNTGSSQIRLADNQPGNQFNGNITVTSTGSSQGIYFGLNAAGRSTFAAGATNKILIGAGFSSGTLGLSGFTQTGTSSQALVLTGSAVLNLGNPSATSFDGDVDFRSPSFAISRTTFNGTAYLEKNGSSLDLFAGGNVFNGATTLSHTGSGQWIFSYNAGPSGDIFNSDLTVVNTGSSTIRLADNQPGNQFNGNITVTSTGSSQGVYFGLSAAGKSTFAAGTTKKIALGAGGFSSGTLGLSGFTQTGTSSQTLLLTGTTLLYIGTSSPSSFDGDVDFRAPRLFLSGATFNGTAYLEKAGAGTDNGSGGNTFNKLATLVNSGSGALITGSSNPDIFNDDLVVTNAGSSQIRLAENRPGNQFNGNITFTSTGSSLGIIIGNNTGTASTFAAGTTKKLLIGASGFSTGTLLFRGFTQTGSSSQTLALTGNALLQVGDIAPYAATVFNGDVDFRSPRLLLNGATYNGTAYIEKLAATNDDGSGGNTFNKPTTIANSGSAYILTGRLSADVFNDDLVVTNTGSSTIRLADNSPGNQFNGNIQLNSNFGGGIYFGNSAASSSTLALNKTIAVGSLGVISGDIRLIRFTQLGATAQTLNLTGIAVLTLGPTSRFDGDVDFRSPQLLLNGTTYNGTAYLEKKGATNNAGSGGNVFNGATTLVDSGSGFLLTANSSPDIFNSTLTVTNTGSNIIYLAHNVAGSQFNGNITFNSTLGSQGIYFADNATGNATLGTGASLLVGGLGFSSGELRLRRFTQTGSSSQTLVLTGTALLRIGPSSTFNGVLDFRAPRLGLDGCTYNGITYLEKTGATTDNSSGGNAFNGVTTLANSGSGILASANSALDTFNGDLTLTNTGSASIRMADNIGGTLFNGNIIVNSTNPTAGSGVFFSNNAVAANATLASGKTITVGATGFTAGELRLIRFTQLGSTAQNLTLTGTALLQLGATSVFNGDVTFRAPQLLLNSTTFNRSSYLEKTGATGNNGAGGATFASGFNATIVNSGTGVLRTNGGNTFNGSTIIQNSATADILLELVTGSTYNGDVTMTNTGTSNIRAAFAGVNTFNGNIIVNSTGGTGITFCESVTATARLTTGTISVGGSGFTTGTLALNRFTQDSAVPQTLTLTSNAILRCFFCWWSASLTATAPSIFLSTNFFYGPSNGFTKTGNTTDASDGSNYFDGPTTITNSGSGVFRFSNVNPDDFNGDVTFNQISGTIEPGYNAIHRYYSNLTVNGSSSITFGANTGGIMFTGGNLQAVNRSGSAIPIFRRLTINKSGGNVTLNTTARITTSATFTSGVIRTSAGNLVSFANGSTTSAGSVASHIDGPVEKIGNAAFTFPTGDNGFFRAISITAPSITTDAYTAEYFKATHPYGDKLTYSGGIYNVSTCEYWLLNRTVGASNVNVTLSWTKADCTGDYITDISKLLVTRWNGTNWLNLGGTSITGTTTSGTVTSTTANTFSLNPSPITLASSTPANPLPIQLLRFTAQSTGNAVELNWSTATEENNDYFSIQRSIDGNEFEEIGRMKGAGMSYSQIDYRYTDTRPLPGLVYYRLRQTDFDLKSTYSDMVSVDVAVDADFVITPNIGKAGVEMKLSATGEYVVYNSLGVIVQQVQDASQIQTDGMVSGVYFVRNSKGKVQRIVIN